MDDAVALPDPSVLTSADAVRKPLPGIEEGAVIPIGLSCDCCEPLFQAFVRLESSPVRLENVGV